MESLTRSLAPALEPLPCLPTLELDGVSISLGGRPILKDTSFAIQPGKMCILLGPNGVGKTTLLRAIDGLIPPTAGQIRVLGQDIKTLSRRELSRSLAYVPQIHQGTFSYPVLDFVLLGRAPYLPWFGSPNSQDHALVERILRWLGIEGLARRNYLQLSGGERQLVLLARGLAQEAAVMLLDEPTAHLDFSHRHHIMGIIKKLVRERNLAALVSLHDPNLALEYGDQIVLLDGDTVAADLKREDAAFLPRLETMLKRVYDAGIKVRRVSDQAVVVRG
ncbi:MAG: ABC transporter ATP-binding protein [Firmicutes bacterium]|nr:ABC transporter ATP-binding protein [Bacillota bacterium]